MSCCFDSKHIISHTSLINFMVFPKQIKKKDPNDAHKEKLT